MHLAYLQKRAVWSLERKKYVQSNDWSKLARIIKMSHFNEYFK